MSPRNGDMSTWQPDLYQRYELLRQLVSAAVGDDTTTPVTVIDVGSGPERLTQQALGEGFDIVRTDVGDFQDAHDGEIVRIYPGAPLPFADDAADVVVAMDVLEHVPDALRSSFLFECGRIARRLVIITCPTDDEAVRAAEGEMNQISVELSGRPMDFLDEHNALGHPSRSATVAELERTCGSVSVLENAPLSVWASSNLIDFALNLRLGADSTRVKVNRQLNDQVVVCPSGEPGYRQFFVGSPDRSVDVEAIASRLRDDRPTPSISSVVTVAIDVLAAELKKLATGALQLQIAALQAAVQGCRRSNEEMLRGRQSIAEQLATARRELAAAHIEYERVNSRLDDYSNAEPSDAPVADVAPPPAITMRAVAGKARRSPRWAARKSRGAYRRLTTTLSDPPSPPPVEADTPSDQSEIVKPPRFEGHWYLVSNPDVGAAGIDPWLHYLRHGQFEGRSPHPLFDRVWYAERYPDAAAGGRDPFIEWATTGVESHRDPNQFFDTEWYLRRHPEVGDAGLDPVEHYRLHGWREGRRPGPLFDPSWYLGTYSDVADADIDPLTHYLQFGRGEGRHPNHLERVAATGWYRPPDGLIPWFSPVAFEVDPQLSTMPCLNVLLPGMGVRHLTGGPNTAIQLGYRLAALGRRVRFIATDAALDDDTSALWAHMANISEVGRRLPNVEVIDGSNRYRAVKIGDNDLFLATAWWTAQSVKAALPLVRQQKFLYLIQDFEPLFFASSSQYALALETYELDHVPIVNSRFLLDHLANERIGRFGDADFVDSAIVFEPTVDRTMFRPTVPTRAKRKRRLLFYARPQNGLRNLFELGVAAIQLAIQQGVLDESEWEFCGMGDPFEPVAVGPRSVLTPLPWRDFGGYAEQMRESDILLSLMLAPHPSYPPLEMAACGGIAVTTVFGPKTSEALAEISANIIGTAATIEGVAQGLSDAVDRLDDLHARLEGSTLRLPSNWNDVFDPVLPVVESELRRLEHSGLRRPQRSSEAPPDSYTRWRSQRITDRVSEYPAPVLPSDTTFSLLTAVWNTPAEFLIELADSVRAQDLDHGWEWVIANNGSTNAETLEVLDLLSEDPRCRVEHHAENLGILGGMRSCLERARGRYVLHLDHDDLLTPDALRVVASALDANGWPRAFYSDEDKVRGRRFLEPYLKPDWDPVLFANSCYIAHLCGVDRELALELDAYLDPYTEASPDWDLFTRLANADVIPLHVREVVYSWRIHSSSTAGNPSAKPYAIATHRRVLERFIDHRADFDRFTVEVHPDSPDRLDWWIRRRHVQPRPLVSVIIGDGPATIQPVPLVDHEIRALGIDDVDQFTSVVETAVERGALIHILNSSARIPRSEWYWESLGLFDLYQDVVAVGGPTIRDQRIHSAGDIFGFGPIGWASPAHGEPHDSRGWFGQNLKQRSTDGIGGDHALFDGELLLRVLAHPQHLRDLSTIGAWCSLEAAASGGRVVYSPLLRAEVSDPFADKWNAADRAAVAQAASNAVSSRNRSSWLSLDSRHPFRPDTRKHREAHIRAVSQTVAPPSISYHEWLTNELTNRTSRYPASADDPSISIITPVYSGTDAELFTELAASLRAQTKPFAEWVIGLDGDISGELADAIAAVAADSATNVRTTGGTKGGILATMRSCLLECTGDYLVPVDADDLLTPDALAILASVAASTGLPDLVHSDEDVFDGGRFRDPFIRPGWDPVLHLAGSYVWHALCIKRSTALDVSMYDDPNLEWCHDWDTVDRIRRIDGSIVHVPEVLYHWRRHTGSSTNTERPESAQQDSVKAMFQRIASDTGHADRYEVTEFPLWRGATELHIRREQLDPPSVALIALAEMSQATRSSVAGSGFYPFTSVHVGPEQIAPVDQLVSCLQQIDADFVWILDRGVIVGDHEPVWEAVKWFELLDDVGAVSGRFIDRNGVVTSGAAVRDPILAGQFLQPLAGRPAEDPGPYALALKPHTVDALDFRSVVADRLRLLSALAEVPASAPINRSGLLAAESLQSAGFRVIYDPLLSALSLDEPQPLIPAETAGRSVHGMGPIAGAKRWFT